VRVCLLISNRPLAWHLALADCLRAAGHEVVVARAKDGHADWHVSARMLFELESLIYTRSGAELLRVMSSLEFPPAADLAHAEAFDICIELAADAVPGIAAKRTLIPLFDDFPSEAGALLALLERRECTIGIRERIGARSWHAAYVPAFDDTFCISRSLANVCSRMAELLADCVAGTHAAAAVEVKSDDGCLSPVVGPADVARYAASVLPAKIARRLSAIVHKGDQWFVAWRDLGNAGPLSSSVSTQATYSLISDDGSGYLADPFPFAVGPQAHLFVEEFDYASGKGSICAFVRGDDGTFGNKRVVIERPYHLSYPTVFSDGGEIWMIPETGAVGRIELYRAVDYPFRWVQDSVLINGINAFDATLHRDRSGYWLFFTTAMWGGSSSDQLRIYHAPALQGPWMPCGAEAGLTDARSARPAGMLFQNEGRLIRPAQDCSRMYGGAIQFCEVQRLTTQEYKQSIVARLEPLDRQSFCGAHTYNAGYGIEVVDVFGSRQNQSNVTLRRQSIAPERPQELLAEEALQ